MNVYFYDENTFELLGMGNANIDPMATKRTGKPVYALPANATFTAPPELRDYQIAIYNVLGDEWEVKNTYKGHYKINTNTMVVSRIETTAPLKSYEILIEKDLYPEVKANPEKFDVIDGKFVNIANTQKYQSKYNIRKYKRLIKETEDAYEKFMNSPVEYNGATYLPRYVDDYVKLEGRTFPMEIWDSTGLKSKLMTLKEFRELKLFLEGIANTAYKKKKVAIKQYRNEIDKLEK